MKKNKLTYERSGVNIKAADKFVSFISSISSKSKQNGNFKNIGGFGSISKIPHNIKNPYIVASTDGVGTKIEIANQFNKFDTIGIDLVAMCVNDLLVQGAKPFLFLDYIAINKIDLKKLKLIIKGIAKGCKTAGCELVGGETAEMPGTYSKGKFDMAGFAIGLVDKKKILYNKKIKNGNLILAVPSNGLHSNGYSLVRNILKNAMKSEKKLLKIELLKPTKIYVKEIIQLINNNLINGCAHITGGGIKDNLKRIIPKGLTADINLKKIKTKKIFSWLKKKGVDDKEMVKTFNCGVGFCLIINSKNLQKIKKYFSYQYKPYLIGKIISGKNKVKLDGKIVW
tara:strand:- start:1004 stop:2023 length:1020 start_codon:yes stop_codon:yes gene_type:complete